MGVRVRIAITADHAGFDLKNKLADQVREWGHELIDLGASEFDALDDYPDYAEAMGVTIARGAAERGILICGSGVGASIAANKILGVRACVCHDSYSARQGVEHDDMNVLVLGSRIVGIELARDLVQVFLTAKFSGEERHRRRLAKVLALESRRHSGAPVP